MDISEIATKEDVQKLQLQVSELTNFLKSNPETIAAIGFVSFKRFKEITGFGDATVWRLLQSGKSIRAYKFSGSNRKFFKVAEINSALEEG